MPYPHPRPGPQGRKRRIFTPAAANPQEAAAFLTEEPASPHRAGHDAGWHAEDAPRTTRADVQGPGRHMYPSQRLAPRSAYRYRPIAEAEDDLAALAAQMGGVPMPDGVLIPQGDDAQWYLHRSPPPRRASRPVPAQIPQRAASRMRETEAPPVRTARRRFHWLWWIGLGLLVMVAGEIALTAVGTWWQTQANDSTYGRPRTFQTDAVVGHGDSPAHPSHFIAVNLHRQVMVIELPGGNLSRAVIYAGPVLLGDGQDLTPVTLSFADRNGDGRPDMLLHILDQTLVFLNNGTKFVPPVGLAEGGITLPRRGG